MTSKQQNENLQLSLKEIPEWFPEDLTEDYQQSDFAYDYFLLRLDEMAAAKRDTIPIETRRVWFIEFVKRGWTKYIFDMQFDALMETEISGHAIRIDDWLRAMKKTIQTPDTYKRIPELTAEEKKNTASILRATINQIDAKMNINKPKPKKNYPALPPNWKSDTLDGFRLGDKIKRDNRT